MSVTFSAAADGKALLTDFRDFSMRFSHGVQEHEKDAASVRYGGHTRRERMGFIYK